MASTSMIGTTGLILIPTAHIITDGKLALGLASYTEAKYASYNFDYVYVYYATIGYLPFLELSLRATKFPGLEWSKTYSSGTERMASVKLQVLKENVYFPSVVLGIHDLYGKSVQFNAQYIVISKSMQIPLIGTMGIHIGDALNPIKSKRIYNYSMKGIFAGIEKDLCKYVTAMLEYDTHKYNLGLRIAPLGNRIYIDVAVLGFKRISGGMNISVDL
jgi:hypothetical protein